MTVMIEGKLSSKITLMRVIERNLEKYKVWGYRSNKTKLIYPVLFTKREILVFREMAEDPSVEGNKAHRLYSALQLAGLLLDLLYDEHRELVFDSEYDITLNLFNPLIVKIDPYHVDDVPENLPYYLDNNL